MSAMEFFEDNKNQTPDTENRENLQINLEKINTIARGDKVFILKLINHFIEEAPSAIVNMEEALKTSSYAEISGLAHKIKPSVGFLGIKELEEEIKLIEEYSRSENNAGYLPALITRFKGGVEEAVAQLKAEKEKLET